MEEVERLEATSRAVRHVPRRRVALMLSLLAGPLALVWAVFTAASASAAINNDQAAVRPAVEAPLVGDDHPGLLEQHRRSARDAALQGVLAGRLTPSAGGDAVELPGSDSPPDLAAPPTTRYADLAVTGTDRALTLLVDFGPGDYLDRTWNGPVHQRAVAGATGSEPAHFDQLLFGEAGLSLRSYLTDQSGGRYALGGQTQDWVGVPHNAAYYGADDCGGAECPTRLAAFAADAVDAFVAGFYARNPVGDLGAFLAPYDQRDRYDGDADGNFDEPDGYVDHLVIVFAGKSQSTTGESDLLYGGFGSISGDDIGVRGPESNLFGGRQLGSSGVWVDSFSAVPEDADLGTVVHTFGHDLGLSDLADPDARANVDTSVQFWSPMAAGATLGAPAARLRSEVRGLGTAAQPGSTADAPLAPADRGVPDLLAVERLQLGWLAYQAVQPGESQTVELSDATSTVGVEAAVIPLGDLPYVAKSTTPAVGEQAFVAANGPSAQAVLQRPLSGTDLTVSWRQWTDVEPVFDTLRVQALTGVGWRDIAPVATGRSGWTTRSAVLPVASTALRFIYSTDAVSTGAGVLLDEIKVGAEATEGAEAGVPAGWTASGWSAGAGRSVETSAPGFYVAERRGLSGYDATLTSSPYVADPRGGSGAVDRFGYDDGVLVTFWDGRAPDNAVSEHPGSGRLLVVDARPEPVETVSGAVAPAGLHPFDAAFGTSWRRGFALDAYAVTSSGAIRADRVRVRAQPPVPTFDDTDPRYGAGSASAGTASAGSVSAATAGQPQLPAVGVSMTVTAEGPVSTIVQFGRG